MRAGVAADIERQVVLGLVGLQEAARGCEELIDGSAVLASDVAVGAHGAMIADPWGGFRERPGAPPGMSCRPGPLPRCPPGSAVGRDELTRDRQADAAPRERLRDRSAR